MANEKVVMNKKTEEEKEIVGYRLLVTAFMPHLSNRSIYMWANGTTYECEDGSEIDVPVLVKEMLDQNERKVLDPKTQKIITEREFKYSIIKTYYKE